MAGWAARVCSRLAEGLLTQVLPALLTTILQSPVVPVGAGSPLAQVSCLGSILGPQHVPDNQGTRECCWGSCC